MLEPDEEGGIMAEGGCADPIVSGMTATAGGGATALALALAAAAAAA
jgi:hypothetical protein